MRDNISRILHAVRSIDGGTTWSAPAATGIADYPAHLLRLRDGRVACVAGRRVPPFGIRLYISEDEGETWRETLPVRDDLPSKDLGYPTLGQREDGTLVVVYYARGPDGVTGIEQTEVLVD
jgi:sialidase-1